MFSCYQKDGFIYMKRFRQINAIALILSVAAALSLGVATTFANQPGPPEVKTGTAQWNCQRIVQAGYSPHDYVRVVTRFQDASYEVDYTHVRTPAYPHPTNSSLGAPASYSLFRYPIQVTNTIQNINGTLIARQDPGKPVVSEYVFETTPNGPPTAVQQGTLTDANGGSLTATSDLNYDTDSGLDSYLWTPLGGGSLEYRDHEVTAYSVDSEWQYRPNWSGPDSARMSSIWSSAEACQA